MLKIKGIGSDLWRNIFCTVSIGGSINVGEDKRAKIPRDFGVNPGLA